MCKRLFTYFNWRKKLTFTQNVKVYLLLLSKMILTIGISKSQEKVWIK